MRPCEICGAPGQRHHIVFRSHGGLDIEVNYAWLCAWHHTQGPDAPHRSRQADLRLKLRMQRDLENMLWADTYRIDEIAKIIGMGKKALARRMHAVPVHMGNYERTEIIKFIMGGKLYERVEKGHERSAASADGFRLLDSAGTDLPDGGGSEEEGRV